MALKRSKWLEMDFCKKVLEIGGLGDMGIGGSPIGSGKTRSSSLGLFSHSSSLITLALCYAQTKSNYFF